MGSELSHEDLSSIAAFVRQLGEASIDTGVDINEGYLWMDGEIVGRIEPADGGGYWFKASS